MKTSLLFCGHLEHNSLRKFLEQKILQTKVVQQNEAHFDAPYYSFVSLMVFVIIKLRGILWFIIS